MRKYIVPLLLACIFLLALILRVFELGSVPNGFHGDEVDVGYEGKYIVMHGVDTYGNKLPLSFDRFGDFRPTGIFYLAGISEMVFGTNEFAVRFPAAIFGALSVIALFYLASRISKNQIAGLCSAAILAVLPWHIVLSRTTSESVIALFFIILGTYFGICFLETQSKKDIALTIIFLFASYLFYHTARLIVPFILLYFVIVSAKDWTLSKSRVIWVVLLCVAIILTGIFVFGNRGGRASQVGFWQLPEQEALIASLSNGDGQNNVLSARLFHNKAVFYTRFVFGQYASYFSGDYLFMHGGKPDRYAVLESGLLYIVQIPLIAMGLYMAWKKRRIRANWLYLLLPFLLLISPLPAALTWEDVPNVQRSSFMILPFALLSGYGLFVFLTHPFSKVVRNVLIVLLIGVSTVEISYFLHQYFVHDSQYRAFTRDQGAAQMMQELTLLQNQNKYDAIYISRDINQLRYLFYKNEFPTHLILPLNSLPAELVFDNVHFIAGEDISNRCVSDRFAKTLSSIKDKKILMIDEGDCKEKPFFTTIYSITRKDQTKGYTFLTYE